MTDVVVSLTLCSLNVPRQVRVVVVVVVVVVAVVVVVVQQTLSSMSRSLLATLTTLPLLQQHKLSQSQTVPLSLVVSLLGIRLGLELTPYPNPRTITA